jgi:NAD(P)-dependent dehydrogenase (short-subunit alcohol dehydrogenase family)
MGIWPTDCFRGSRVLVVGGTSGIGAGIAAAFLAERAEVTVTGATEAEAAAAAGTGVRSLVLDVRDAGQVVSVIDELSALDHLVYCAGIIRRGAEHDPAVFAEVLDVNLTGAMRVSSAVRPLLTARGGTITLMASMLSYFGGGLVPGYSASKGGIVQLSKSLAIAYASDGIRVNAIAPGWIATDLTKPLRDDPTREAAILGRTPLGRWGQAQDVAGGALFLASPLAGFVTGTVLPIDGGYLAV